jgi:endonuclease/exonuclease/phosphatase family metal-dependent hydrolase
VLANLDRVFISTYWEAAFPLVRMNALAKSVSDHVPLLVDTGTNHLVGKKKFIFEK